ncbi:class I fructose-bisphosphate aldolase [Marinimicrobium sp. ABcell2]|uniref:class I fructose-bisphosphate aldolase n=1 Tax=Marinimicrobium sp. ABcell2 TaxID=3069751 RepID=UPI0027AF327E|nr:class I fructose-bisphosphate aldolase [Marinimicrobium sp. ABcell2]MDQ2076849.1 class I fructose-bisphosphate aldolase [Marinimicrobium sp. ABcell2]
MSYFRELQATIDDLADPHRGILAADESSGTIAKRFETVGAENTEDNRRWYRDMLFSAPEVGKYLSGIILFEETLNQTDTHGTPFPELIVNQGMVPGIKVDLGKGSLPGASGDMISYGLDGLADRLATYRERGARFAKWRSVYPITDHNPTPLGLSANAEVLARYAAECQAAGIVPIVEPEVLIDGNHSMMRAARVNEHVWHSVFHALHQHGVTLEHMILKPSMVTPGKAIGKASPDEVAEATLNSLLRTVPAAVPSINFLSGGQTPTEATANINAINQHGTRAPWLLSISFARALQEPALEAWGGKPENHDRAQAAFLKRARLNSLALQGEYSEDMENR